MSFKIYHNITDLVTFTNYFNLKNFDEGAPFYSNIKQVLEPYSSFFPAVFGKTKSRCST